MSRAVGEVMFICGKAGGMYVSDEHDVAAEEYAKERNQEHRRRTGRWGSLDEQVDWLIEGREVSERRTMMSESQLIADAIDLLKRHGYGIRRPSRPAGGTET